MWLATYNVIDFPQTCDFNEIGIFMKEFFSGPTLQYVE